jgi:hypothetical protein
MLRCARVSPFPDRVESCERSSSGEWAASCENTSAISTLPGQATRPTRDSMCSPTDQAVFQSRKWRSRGRPATETSERGESRLTSTGSSKTACAPKRTSGPPPHVFPPGDKRATTRRKSPSSVRANWPRMVRWLASSSCGGVVSSHAR